MEPCDIRRPGRRRVGVLEGQGVAEEMESMRCQPMPAAAACSASKRERTDR